MSLEQFLKERGYTPDEIQETEIRLENSMEIPKEILKDIKEYFNTWRIKK